MASIWHLRLLSLSRWGKEKARRVPEWRLVIESGSITLATGRDTREEVLEDQVADEEESLSSGIWD